MTRYNRAENAGRYAAQEARKNARAGDSEFARGEGRTRWTTGVQPAYERDVLAAVIEVLTFHPRVAWAVRMNTGGVERSNTDGTKRYIAFAFKGCADIIGQMRDGRFLAIEVKRPGATATADQLAFIGGVARNNGVAFVAWSVDDVTRGLA